MVSFKLNKDIAGTVYRQMPAHHVREGQINITKYTQGDP